MQARNRLVSSLPEAEVDEGVPSMQARNRLVSSLPEAEVGQSWEWVEKRDLGRLSERAI
jgi:hypothetical protein